MFKVISIILIFSVLSSNTKAQAFSSGLPKVPLIELYTSEGCSSCPPADKWMSKLVNHEQLWSHFVPIAFHVDYWDYIGWSDPFATQSNTLRQRRYRQQGNIKTVYTPGFVYMGNEWRSWYLNKTLPQVDWNDIGKLEVKINSQFANIQFTPINILNKKLKINVAVIGFDLKSQVIRGENKGKVLRHDFVKLSLTKAVTYQSNNQYQWKVQLPNTHNYPTKKLAYAIWVTEPNKQQPIQSVGAWME